MSKIEKALNKARAQRGQAGPSTPESSAQNAGQMVPLSPASTPVPASEAPVASSQSIALMRESVLRAPADLAQIGIIHPGMEENETVRTFREIRTRILQKSHGGNGVLMVTGVSGQDGATFVALNLGAVFSFDAGKTALVMDCNLHKPWMENLFTQQAPAGLTDYLDNPEMDVSQIIHSVGIERLRVIPAGGKRESAAEYFTSVRMKQLLDGMRRRYAERFIIIDAPPMSESADAHILAELCDYIVLVVPYGKVTGAQLESCLRAIDSKKLLGVVFNNEPKLPDLEWGKIVPDDIQGWMDKGIQTLKALRDAVKRKK